MNTSIEFQIPQLNDKDLFDRYFKREVLYSCEFTFANIYLWSQHYKVRFAIVEDSIVFQSGINEQNQERISFSFPIGSKDFTVPFNRLMEYCREQEIPFQMYNITPDMQKRIQEHYPDQFLFTPDRDSFDYIYNTSDLVQLPGKKYHGKRNHINQLKEKDWLYESITKDNMDECLMMNDQWCMINGCKEDETKKAEYCLIQTAFEHYDKLGLVGGLIRLNGQVIAFSLGEKINDQVFVVHIEKAFSDIQGAYPMINREFAAHEAGNCIYINREEDMGLEGLRKAKLSYRPAILLEKSIMTCK